MEKYILIFKIQAVFIEFKEFRIQKHKAVHTSAATVAVLPEAEEVDVKIEEKDLELMYLEAVVQEDKVLTQQIAQLE